nr:hypothetical protein [Escherichia coli]
SMKGSWLQLVIGVLDIVIAWIFLGATPMVSVTLVSTLVGIELKHCIAKRVLTGS